MSQQCDFWENEFLQNSLTSLNVSLSIMGDVPDDIQKFNSLKELIMRSADVSQESLSKIKEALPNTTIYH